MCHPYLLLSKIVAYHEASPHQGRFGDCLTQGSWQKGRNIYSGRNREPPSSLPRKRQRELQVIQAGSYICDNPFVEPSVSEGDESRGV